MSKYRGKYPNRIREMWVSRSGGVSYVHMVLNSGVKRVASAPDLKGILPKLRSECPECAK